LINKLLENFIRQNIYAVDLQCSPASSEVVWKKLGFRDISNFSEGKRFSPTGNKQLYRILIPHLETTIGQDKDEYIELWNDEHHLTNDCNPSWIWALQFIRGTRKLEKPIICPGHYKWRIRWSQNKTVIKDTEVKYFDKNEIYFGEFIIIRTLPINNNLL
jgi:hypothetical protein